MTDIREQIEDHGLVFPDYDNSIANIKHTVLELLTGEVSDQSIQRFDTEPYTEHDRVVLFIIDGLGMVQLENTENPFFTSLREREDAEELTSVFPSATAAAMTAIALGAPPQHHGVVEWYTYLPELQQVVMPLPFIDMDGNDLHDVYGYDTDQLVQGTPLTQEAANHGIDTHVFMPEKIVESRTTEALYAGANRHGYTSLADLGVELGTFLEEPLEGSELVTVYIPDLDSLSHMRGPDSPNHEAELDMIAYMLETHIAPREIQDTVFLFTADHGHIDTTDNGYTDLDTVPGVAELFTVNAFGEPVKGIGNNRDVFLFTQENDEIEKMLDEHLPNSLLLDTSACLEAGLFGEGEPSQRFKERVGDLLLLPLGNDQVWFGDSGGDFRGMHGGLSPEEMRVPFIPVPGDEL